MKKRIFSLIMAVLLVAAMLPVNAVYAGTGDINVTVNGQLVVFEGQGPVIVDGRTLVPVRGVFEMLGFQVTWLADSRTVMLTDGRFVVLIPIDSPMFSTNGRYHMLDVPAQIINDSTMLPIRPVVESVGLNVEWIASTSTVSITTPLPDTATLPGAASPPPAEGFALEWAGANVTIVVYRQTPGRPGFDLVGWGNDRLSPVLVANDMIAVSVGLDHNMAIDSSGTLWGWGDNRFGQIGDGTNTFRENPIWVMDNVVAVSTSTGHTLAIRSDGSLWGWGVHNLWIDGTNVSNSPIHILDNVVAASAGDGHSMAIQSDGSLWGWGMNAHGRIGDGTTTDRRDAPVHIMDNVASVSAGRYHTMAIRTDGSLWGWGHNFYGQIGDGTTINRYSPVHVMDNVLAVSANIHTLAIRGDNSLWGWGNNQFGQVGDGTTTNRHAPVRIMDGVIAASAGLSHSMAAGTDLGVWGWGANHRGQVGDGTTISRLSPVRIN